LIGRRGGKRYRLGDRIEVTVARVDVDRRELDLTLGTTPLEEFEERPRTPRPPRDRPSGRPSSGPKSTRNPTKATKGKRRAK
jgi:ribonuclease R